MSTIVSMPRARFQELATPISVSYRTEKEWYITEDEARIGAVVYDRIDSDWSFVALTQQPGNDDIPYAVFDLAVSFATATEARKALMAALQTDGRESPAQAE